MVDSTYSLPVLNIVKPASLSVYQWQTLSTFKLKKEVAMQPLIHRYFSISIFVRAASTALA